jgi:hypothetical protein
MKLFSILSFALALGTSSAFQIVDPEVDEGIIAFETTRVENNLEELINGNKTHQKRDIIANWINSDNQQSLFTFTGSIYVGTPGQKFKVIFDSGSFQFWVRSSKCTNSGCAGKSAFNSAASSTFRDTGVASSPIRYADGTTISGNFVQDTVAIYGKQTVSHFSFIEASSAANIPGVDGVIGIARPYSQHIKQYMFLYQLLNTKSMTWPCYSWFIDNSSSKGQFVIGGVDNKKFHGKLSWSNIIDRNGAYWATSFGTIQGANVHVTPQAGLKAVFDTGTSLAYMLPDLAQKLNAQIGATLYSNNGGVQNYMVDCAKIPYMPTLYWQFGTVQLAVSPNEYVYVLGSNFCMSGFVGMTIDPTIGILIGNVLMRRWYTVFDMQNDRIGFADAKR